ncbi:alpha/beta hydrolase [Serratia marcescens]|uniref:alpha/beta hydrolase n=1 Tax=Serratia marcescens TaxID=615 RepID=UPI00275BFC18|nr:alpha/beta hydrolase [Serratia marcescens]MDP8600359.1 alpha/beta hydrolase [Serratia marcescens]MDP8685059.1 alpha/beta hydrolase [Serratia marcescens]MDP8734586.1 alpha/beta hydrolase [Serratia marcescens]MDP8793957.1 alpha/beta hydrolase [Serratia marcescens]HEJ7834112.1 alpha/beta hydrolase [Serratia marcescens]
MPLDERIAAFLTASADAPPPASLAEMRAAAETGLRRLQGKAEPSGGVRDFTVVAADGYRIALRAYLPAGENRAAAQPAMLFAHGGGWCLGSLALYDRPCQALANATGRVILSVDYRLAPESPFPQPLEDVYRALCWVAQQAPQLGIDAKRLAVGGDSAGGNLAAAVALLARDRGGPHIERQLLLYPALSREMTTKSYCEFAEGDFLTRDAMVFCWQQYLAQRRDPGAEPLHAATLRGLPPATILSCEYDPLRDEAEQYAQRLREAGVPVRCERLPGMVHACIHMLGLTPAARRLFELARE